MATHHIAAMLSPAWGHTVSYISVAIQMLQKDPTLVITIVQHNSAVAQMEAELQTWTYDSVRLRIVGVGDKVIAFGADWIKVASAQLTEGWLATLSKLVQGSEGWPTPHAIHLDFLGGGFVVEPRRK
ncbi:hypothetical protein C8R44DRAFT_888484 [Mycena epipterygia]|nr:hypothetical protein C8R44DRAFT_888484 [Mycena epipterygia]